MNLLSSHSLINDGQGIDILWIYDPLNTKRKVRTHILHELSHIKNTAKLHQTFKIHSL